MFSTIRHEISHPHTQRDKCKETENVIKHKCATLAFKQCSPKINKRSRRTKKAVLLINNDSVREKLREGKKGWEECRMNFVYCNPWWPQDIVELKRVEQRKTSSDFPRLLPRIGWEWSYICSSKERMSKVEREGKNPFIDLLSHHMLSPSLQLSISLTSHTHNTHIHTQAGELGT